MQKLQIYMKKLSKGGNDRDLSLGMIRHVPNLAAMTTTSKSPYLIMTPPLPADQAYYALNSLERRLQGRWAALHRTVFGITAVLTGWPRHYSDRVELIRQGRELIPTLCSVLSGRIALERRLTAILRKRGLWLA